MALVTRQARADSPGLLWSTNLAANLFAVDEQTNVYASVGGSVIKLNGNGLPLQTNTICPIPGIAQRDAFGNYYFAGNFDGTQDFGGITLVGGWTNNPSNPGQWNPGSPTHYVAKYTSNGGLLWVTSFGAQGIHGLRLTDLLIDPSGGVLAGHLGMGSFPGSPIVTRLSSTGTIQWSKAVNLSGFKQTIRLGGLTSSNFCFSYHDSSIINAGRLDYGGNQMGTQTAAFVQLAPPSDEVANARLVIDDQARLFLIGRTNIQQLVCKFTVAGPLVWAKQIPTSVQWTLARDAAASVYSGATDGSLVKYDVDGNEIWAANYQSNKVTSMLVYASGNRFLNFANGGIARLGPEAAPQAPQLVASPQSQTVFSGTNVTLSVSANGTPPLRYFWRLSGTNLPGATNATLSLINPNSGQSGNYTVVVTNQGGAITSAPALVRIKAVQFFLGNQMLTNGTYNFITPPTLSIASAFTNGSSFYTLDGSTPTFGSTFYTAPFVASTSATVRALGYSADFSQSEEADPVNIVLPPSFPMTVTSTPGGSVAMNPPGGAYLSNTVVTLTATPTGGWSFLYWQGDANGSSPSVNVTMTSAKSVHAVFGSTISTTVAGSGQVQLYPPGGVYPYGSTVRLTAVPQPGNYFGVWGNAASGSANPLYFMLTNPNPTISSLFAPLAANQAALTVLISGPGTVQVSPSGNVFTTNQIVNITATPLAGQGFINWSSDASGTQNPVSVAMTQSRTVTANFTNWPVLFADRQSITPEGFRLTVLSGPGLVYQIQGSANLGTWVNLGVVTNTSGESQFTDPAGTNLPLRYYRGVSWP